MAGRKQLVRDRNHLASVLCKLEGGKSSVKIGDMRQTLRLMVVLEAAVVKAGWKSPMMLLHREAVAKAKALTGRQLGRTKALITK